MRVCAWRGAKLKASIPCRYCAHANTSIARAECTPHHSPEGLLYLTPDFIDTYTGGGERGWSNAVQRLLRVHHDTRGRLLRVYHDT